ncbi:hypothetical protein EVAR_33761_1 [Eumeta japonica]|uniref:Uncharacterized protein n=1 Tax=Eumeta variegata TaxID=151549 RepID=A0A4C1VVT5_EUMVA|nr:hypothetical protein EVAR_33761_1 [Eumeta japonica]
MPRFADRRRQRLQVVEVATGLPIYDLQRRTASIIVLFVAFVLVALISRQTDANRRCYRDPSYGYLVGAREQGNLEGDERSSETQCDVAL